MEIYKIILFIIYKIRIRLIQKVLLKINDEFVYKSYSNNMLNKNRYIIFLIIHSKI